MSIGVSGRSLRSVRGVSKKETLPVTFSDLGSPIKTRLETRPDVNSDAVHAAMFSECVHNSASQIIGAGHNVGILGMVDGLPGSGNVAAAYGVEGRIQQQGGYTNVAAAIVAAFQSVSEGAGGTIGIGAQFYGTSMTDHSHIASKFGVYMSDLVAENRFDGPINAKYGELKQNDRRVDGVSVWVNFDASSTPLITNGNLGVSSITDHGVGDFSFNFSSNLGSTNCAVIAGGAGVYKTEVVSKSVSAIRISYHTVSGAAVDENDCYFAVLGGRT